jgi:hypothetical protein
MSSKVNIKGMKYNMLTNTQSLCFTCQRMKWDMTNLEFSNKINQIISHTKGVQNAK